MKRLLTVLLLIAVLCAFVSSCKYLPESVQSALDGIIPGSDKDNNDTNDDTNDDQNTPPSTDDTPHEHNFELTESKDATCYKDGVSSYACACGERKEETTPALGHDMRVKSTSDPTCDRPGSITYKCRRCGKTSEETVSALGHQMSDFVEASRLIACERSGCSYGYMPKGDGTYDEVLVYKFNEDDEYRVNVLFEELDVLFADAVAYDETLHGYAEEGELAEAYAVIEAKYEEIYDFIMYATTQYQLSQVKYFQNMSNTELKDTHDYITEYRTELVSRFFAYYQNFYDTMYKEFFFYGLTEEEAYALVLESNAASSPEYQALVNRNSEIELEFYDIPDPATSDKVPELYAEFVANNNAIAQIFGYDNYLAYAYENVYDRDYSYTDVKQIVDYVKRYITTPYCGIYAEYIDIMTNGSISDGDYRAYENVSVKSFFTNKEANNHLNNYIDLMSFTSNPEKQLSFSDSFNDLMSKGNMFRGVYEGAYVTYLSSLELPIAYFGRGYDNSFTVAHEFGHYMNELYNNDEYNQSFDLLEMHSQGNELLYLCYLKDHLPAGAYQLSEQYQILVMLNTIVAALSVDTFEQAVYTGEYEGTYADEIMADGKIGADEYDLLYEGILEDFGVLEYHGTDYWRYMTITSPCYYVSYSVSALSVLQIYANAKNTSFDEAKESYLKLFTYTDVNPEMTTEEVLEYAGLYSFTDEDLYRLLSRLANNYT